MNSKLFEQIRIKPKRGGKAKAGAATTAGADDPVCQWDGCERPGSHRAPVGRAKEGEYFRFCVDHVRQYNKGYNYFSGLSDGEIARYQKEAMTGHRPTWKMGSLSSNTQASPNPDMSSFRSGRAGYYARTGQRQPGGNRQAQPQARVVKPLERKALTTLGLSADAEGETIRTRYTQLIKQYHPDANSGDRSSEDRFREVVSAYRLLKQSGFC